MVSTTFTTAVEQHRPDIAKLARAFTTLGKRSNKKSVDEDSPSSSTSYALPPSTSSSSSPKQHIGRAASQRAGRLVSPAQISAPVALMSTSNMQVHNAKHIAGTNMIAIHQVGNNPPSSSSSSSSASGSSNASVFGDDSGHDDNVTDASSIDDSDNVSPLRESGEVKPNHLSCYFKPTVDTTIAGKIITAGHQQQRSRSSTTTSSPSLSPYSEAYQSASSSAAVSPITPPDETDELDFSSKANKSPSSNADEEDTPRLPQRVPSHSKRAHERLHRTRSLQRSLSTSSPRLSRRSSGYGSGFAGGRSSSTHSRQQSSSSFVESASGERPSSPSSPLSAGVGAMPFGKELAQLEEVAEEFGASLPAAETNVSPLSEDFSAEGEEFVGGAPAAEKAFLSQQGFAILGAEDYCSEIDALVKETFGVVGAFDEGDEVANFF